MNWSPSHCWFSSIWPPGTCIRHIYSLFPSFSLRTIADFHETARPVNKNLHPTPTQASIRILKSPIPPGSMQVEFKVEVRRCHLSVELPGSSPLPQSPKGSGFHHPTAPAKSSRHLRKGFIK